MDEPLECRKTTFNLETFVDEHRATFPRVVRVTEGFWADSAEETLEHGQILILHEVQQEQFVVATQSNGVDICIPRKCPVKVELVPLDRLNEEYSTVEELFMAQLDYFRVLDDMPSFNITAGSVIKITLTQGESNHLKCELLGHDGQHEVNLPFTEQGRFQPLHNGIEYFLEEVLEQYSLPSKIGIRLVNDFRLPFKSTLPWGVGLDLQKDFQEETIIATIVGGEGEGDVLLFPKTLDLTVIPDLDGGVRSEEELIHSCQLWRVGSLNRVARLSAVRAYSAKSPVRRFNLECLTPPPLTKPSESGAAENTPPRADSSNPTAKVTDQMSTTNSCHPSLRQAHTVEDLRRVNKSQTALLACFLPGASNQTFSDPEIVLMEPEMTHTETTTAATNDSCVTPALPIKQNGYDARCQMLPCRNRNPPFHSGRQGTSIQRSSKPKQKMKSTDEAQSDNERDVASGNTSRFTPPLPRKQNDTRGTMPINIAKQQDSEQICYRIGPDESRKEAILGTSQATTQPIIKPRMPPKGAPSTSPFTTESDRCPSAPLMPTNATKSIDGQNVIASRLTSTRGTDPGSEPTQAKLACQNSHLSEIKYTNVNSQSQVVEETEERLLLGMSTHTSSPPFATMKRTLHRCCEETLQLEPGPQQQEGRQNHAGRDFLSHGDSWSPGHLAVMCSPASVGAEVRTSDCARLNESVFHVASSQWILPFEGLAPSSAETPQKRFPCSLPQKSHHYVNHSPFPDTLSTNGAGTVSTLKLPTPPYVNHNPRSSQFLSEEAATLRQCHFQMDEGGRTRPTPDPALKSPSLPYVNYDPRSPQFRTEEDAGIVEKSATLAHYDFQMGGGNRARPPPDSALKSPSLPYVNYDPRSPQFRIEKDAGIVEKSTTLAHSDFQMDGGNRARPLIPDSALKSQSPPYMNYSPRSCQFRSEDSATTIERSATLGHSFRNVPFPLKDKQRPDDSNYYRAILPGLRAMNSISGVEFRQVENHTTNSVQFENDEGGNVGAYACTTALQQPTTPFQITSFPGKDTQRKKDQGTQRDGMPCPDQVQNALAPSTLIKSDRNRDFEDVHVLNLYIDMRAQLTLQQEQHEAEVNLLKADIARLEAELERVHNVKSVEEKHTKDCQTLEGEVGSKDTGANIMKHQDRASTKPENLSVRATCHTYENDPRLNGGNVTTHDASVIYRTATCTPTAAQNSCESHQNDPRQITVCKENKKPLPTPRTMKVFKQ